MRLSSGRTPASSLRKDKGRHASLSGRLAAWEPVLEAIDVQSAIAEYPDLYRHRIGGVILVEQVPEVEGARSGGRFPFQAPESLALI